MSLLFKIGYSWPSDTLDSTKVLFLFLYQKNFNHFTSSRKISHSKI